MRTVSLYLGVPAALAMMVVSMGCNWLYLSGFGQTVGAILLLSAASIAIDVLKALAPFWLRTSREITATSRAT
jgi:glycine cleavage system regulatory protein